MEQKKYFVTGIGTEIGKTVCSAILVEALQADYWKPVQSGDLHFTDSDKIKKWTNCSKLHPETYKLNTPASPHYSAEIDGVNIQLNQFNIPFTNNHLIVEGAGGLLVPLNDDKTILDLIIQLNIPVILIISHYLGSINHSLLSIKMIQEKNINIHRIIFSGESNIPSEEIIIKMSGIEKNKFIHVPKIEEINKENITQAAQKIKSYL